MKGMTTILRPAALLAAVSAMAISTAAMAQDAPSAGQPAPSDAKPEAAKAGKPRKPATATTRQPPIGSDDIVITAERRTQTVAKTAIAITAMPADLRDDLGILTVADLTDVVPGLTYNAAQDKVFIRGVGRQTNGVGTDPGVALYNDGFYSPSTASAGSSPLFIQRIEILRGPQGTLYGRNSVGGAINVISARPTKDWSAELRGSYANYDRSEVRGTISGPITGNLGFRLNAQWVRQADGYFRNVSGGPDEGGVANDKYVEAMVDGTFGRLDVFIKYGKSIQDDSGRAFASAQPYNTTALFTGPLAPNPTYLSSVANPAATDLRLFNTNVPTETRLRDHNLLVANLTLHLPGVDVKYVGGWQKYIFDQIQDYDDSAVISYQYKPAAATAPLTISADYRRRYIEDRSYYSHEFDFVSTRPGPLQWIVGLYYLRDYFRQPVTIYAPNQPELEAPLLQGSAQPAPANPDRNYYSTLGVQKSDSYAVFGQLDWNVTSTLRFTGGLRWNLDEKSGYEQAQSYYYNPTLGKNIGWKCVTPTNCVGIAYQTQNASRRLSDSWSGVSGTAGLQWTPDRRTLAYLKYSRGFKSGGFNLGPVALVPEVGSEKIDAIEFGAKRSFGRRFWVNLAAYDYRYHDLQISLLIVPGGGQQARTDLINLTQVHSQGVELEANLAITRRFNIYGSFGLTRGTIAKGCCYVDPLDLKALLPSARPSGPAGANGTQAQDLAGNDLPGNGTKFAIAPSYRFPLLGGSVLVSGLYAWRSSVDSGLFNDGLVSAPAYGRTDVRVAFTAKGQRFKIIGFGRNIFNVRGYDGVGATQTATGIYPNYSLRLPVTYGAELQIKF